MGIDWQVTVYYIDTSNIVCMKFLFFDLHNYPSYNHNHIKLVKFSRRGGGGGRVELPLLLSVLSTALLDLYYVWL